MKNITLIRHGESLGQTARVNNLNRKKDASLTDCFLSPQGIRQALNLRKEINTLHNQQKFDLVCVSPLTRAVATCVLGLGHLLLVQDEDDNYEDEKEVRGGVGECKSECECRSMDSSNIAAIPPFICHPDLAESGGKIPENIGRPIKKVIKSIEDNLNYISPSYAAVTSIDFSLVLPPSSSWPPNDGSAERGHVQYFLEWLSQRPETNIAVVCHHNIILTLLSYKVNRVGNCVPIQCTMEDGDVRSLHLLPSLTTRNNEVQVSGAAASTRNDTTQKNENRSTCNNSNNNMSGKKKKNANKRNKH